MSWIFFESRLQNANHGAKAQVRCRFLGLLLGPMEGLCVPHCIGTRHPSREALGVNRSHCTNLSNQPNHGLVWLKTMPLASLADVMGMLGTPVTRQSVPGGLSTLSYRGGGATHNDLTWGDFSLNHPMNRTTDLQLVPVWLFQGLGLDNGGEALRTGGYGMGGGIGLGSLTSPPIP